MAVSTPFVRMCTGVQVWSKTPGFGETPFLECLWSSIDEVQSHGSGAHVEPKHPCITAFKRPGHATALRGRQAPPQLRHALRLHPAAMLRVMRACAVLRRAF